MSNCSKCGSLEHSTINCPHGILSDKCSHCGSQDHATVDCPHGIASQKCSRCGSREHATIDCPHGIAALKCSSCGSLDHASADCPHGFLSDRCTLCGSRNHSTADCPQGLSYNSPESNSKGDDSDGDNVKLIVGLMALGAIAVVVYVVYWLSVNLVLPLLLLNSALWLTVYACITKRQKTLFFALAFVGGGYLLFDISEGWLSQNFVNNVTGEPIWLDVFVCVNAAALGLAAWFLTKGIRDAAYEVEDSDVSSYQLKLGTAVSAIAIAAISLPLFHFTMKPHPEEDAQGIAAEQCNCVEQSNKQRAEAGQQFLDSFGSRQFKTRNEARAAYAVVYNAADEAFNTCTGTVQAKLVAKQAEHRSNLHYGKALMAAFHGLSGTCFLDPGIRERMDPKAHEYAETITEPRPDVERMKADLIGHTIPNWTFKGVSDFANVVDSTGSASDTRYESHLAIDLNDPDGRSPRAKLMLVYNLRDGQWWLEQTKFKEVVYHLTAPQGSWYNWPVPKGVTYTFRSDRIFVQTDYGFGTIKCGPDVGDMKIPNSNTLRFASREKNATASIRFTFRATDNVVQ